MSKTSAKRIAARRTALFHQQNRLCFWCEDEMLPTETWPTNSRGPVPERLCTLDHFDDRNNPLRGKLGARFERSVAACWTCNQQRALGGVHTEAIEAKRLADGRYVPAAALAGGNPPPAAVRAPLLLATCGDPSPRSPFEVLAELLPEDAR